MRRSPAAAGLGTAARHVACARRSALKGLLAIAAGAGLLSACSTTPAPNTPALAADPVWSGRLALRVEAHDGAPARQASLGFELRGRPEAGRLVLTSPIGTTLASARWQPGQVLMRLPDQTEAAYASLDDLSQHLLGERLPIAALFNWLDARPMPDWPHQPFGPLPDGSAGFEQAGWRVDTSRRENASLQLSRAAPPRVALRVRLDEPSR